jgi:hypothetical protein
MSGCATGCTIRDQHIPDCATDECGGCVPRLAATGLEVCASCESKATIACDELPQLWADLAERPRTAGVSTYGGSSGDPEACPDCDAGLPCPRSHRDTPSPLAQEAIEARSTIRAHLVTWCHVLEQTHRITLPSEARIAATTRQLAKDASTWAAAHRRGAALTYRANPAKARQHVAEAHRQDALAAAARHDRETGLDITRALAEHVRRHLGTLLADEHAAPVVVDDLTSALREARRRANRSRSRTIRIACPCGARPVVPSDVTPGDDPWITCESCGDAGVLSWWLDSAPAAAPMTLSALRGWLLTAHGRDIPIETLRTWSKPRTGEVDPVLPSVGVDDRGRKLYDPPVAAELALARTTRRRAGAA